MLVLIDESGDAGFKFDRGSTKYFVLAAIIFDDDLQAEKLAVELKLLRRALGLRDGFEFHFNGCAPKFKQAFLQCAKKGNFRARCLVIDKRLITSHELKTRKSSFYNYAIKLLLDDRKGGLKNASVKIDGQGDRAYKQAASNYLKRELNTRTNRKVAKVKMVDSKKDILIQLADMVCGAVAHSCYEEKKDAGIYLKTINPRIENVWRFGLK